MAKAKIELLLGNLLSALGRNRFQYEEDLIVDLIEKLDSREQKVLVFRYGLLSGETQTLEEVGEEFGVTRERIRQIESKALERIGDELEYRIFKRNFKYFQARMEREKKA